MQPWSFENAWIKSRRHKHTEMSTDPDPTGDHIKSTDDYDV